MSSARAERLVNLVLCLLSTRQFLTAERIRQIVPGYADARGDEAFFRMFERDKNELRELGVPLETGRLSSFDTVDGYRIARQDYELGEIDLEPDEAAAVALAARLWDSPELAMPAHGALVKLRAAGVEVDEEQGRVQPRVRATDPAFAPLLAAVQAGRVVTVRPPARRRRRSASSGAPWSRGAWCPGGGAGTWSGTTATATAPRSLPGLPDHASRSRPIGPAGAVQVPDGVDLMAMVRQGVDPAAVPPAPPGSGWPTGRAHGLRRLGRVVGRRTRAGRAGDELELELRGLETVARWLAGHGPDVAVLDPPRLAAAVRANWAAAVAAHAEPLART